MPVVCGSESLEMLSVPVDTVGQVDGEILLAGREAHGEPVPLAATGISVCTSPNPTMLDPHITGDRARYRLGDAPVAAVTPNLRSCEAM